ncbi:GNAT family N-acetyltransferase [Pseudoalteromonas sp. DL2-H2.2]|uniref:GNAT family N-acetyltransferase n=1 Tax=Pseudoalteromonas sp. DL2-H2.2 TaxID=2908889 RepID=UPI001F207719|nr:GNAT family N-acetyltransferase [Pseudoalteromonas sp. DL2-H2.2]MCF2910748.1 GNAT family N-acetyltransferase [Pseudoalteromonas sp. DL2-H2.2]
MNIQPYQEKWASDIADLFHAAVHAIDDEVYGSAQKAVWAPSPPDYAFWSQRLAKKQPWVALSNDQVVGFIELDPDGHIDCTYVHPDFQGIGVAGALYDKVEKQAIKQGLSRLYVEASIPARHFFAARGFSLVKRNQIERQGVTLVNFSMEKHL